MRSTWTLVGSLDAATRTEVDTLVADAERARSDEALTEDQREHLARGERVQHLLRREPDGSLTGYAVLVHGDPDTVEPALGGYDDALAALLEARGVPTTLRLRPAPDDVVAELLGRGWRVTRALRRLRRPLPADPAPPTALLVRAFRTGHDEAAWVAQNNASFAGHPTQAHMTVERVRQREAAAWFDPAGFLLVYDGDALVASCWTKVHDYAGGAVGEIYVISVAPDAQGRGLGRLAVLLGLEHLTARGLDTAELFVEETNAGAIALYEQLGFRMVSRVVELRVDAGAQAAPTARPTP